MSKWEWLACSLLALAACGEDQPADPGGDASPSNAVQAVSPRASATTSVYLDGLDSPRGLAFGPEGALYVVETGNATINGPCMTVARGQSCYSGTGAVTRYWKGRRERVVSGLPSIYNPATLDITGPHDIAFLGRGNAAVSIGWGADPALRSGLGALGANFGHLIQLSASGQWRSVADISAVEIAENPAGGPQDSNPYGVLNEAGRRFVTDAGGNSLIEVGANGATSVVAVFAPLPAPPPFNQSEAVPTEVQRGPDGALYVSTLSGVPFVAGNAAIYRVVPGQAPVVYAGGFKTITDFAFAPDGGMYVLEYASAPVFFGGPGRLIHVAPGGARTVVTAALSFPTGVVVGPDGAVYVSNNGSQPGIGQVLRIVP